MAAIHITDIEAAINYWRERKPSPDGITLAPEMRALAEVYALMVFHHEDEVDEFGFPAKAWDAWLAWYQTTPDTPCIAICSTSQGDDECKGCGRSFDEVQHWPAMTPAEKRVDLAPHHHAGHGLALQQVCGAGARGRTGLSAARCRLKPTMRRLAQAPNLAIATLWADALRGQGIEACVQREYLAGAAGELPPDQCLPEDLGRGRRAVAARRATACRRCSIRRSGAGTASAANWWKAASSSAGAAAP